MRLRDVANVVDGAENTKLGAWAERRRRPIILNVQRQPGANVIATVDAIKELLPAAAGQPAGRRSTSTC